MILRDFPDALRLLATNLYDGDFVAIGNAARINISLTHPKYPRICQLTVEQLCLTDTGRDEMETEQQKIPHERVIRDRAFAQRLMQASDLHPQVPGMHQGRQRWIREEMVTRFDGKLSAESVSRWFKGESRPRPDKMRQLAEILSVDEAWLSLGIDTALPMKDRKLRDAMADGAVNVVAGLIQMDGGTPSFPQEGDKRAVADHIDLRAIIKGASYAFNVSVGAVDGDTAMFSLPAVSNDVIAIGLVRLTGFALQLYEISLEALAAAKTRGGRLEVVVPLSDLQEITSFSNRI